MRCRALPLGHQDYGGECDGSETRGVKCLSFGLSWEVIAMSSCVVHLLAARHFISYISQLVPDGASEDLRTASHSCAHFHK